MENSMDISQKTKNRVSIWSNNPTSGHISGKNSNSKPYMHPDVHSIITYNSHGMEDTRWMDLEDVVCVHPMEYYSAIKRMN